MSDCQSQVVQEGPGNLLIQENQEIQEAPGYHCSLVALLDLTPCLYCLCWLPKVKKKIKTTKERVIMILDDPNDPRVKDGCHVGHVSNSC